MEAPDSCCLKWKMSFHVIVRHLKERLWENKQLWCCWTTLGFQSPAFGWLKAEEWRGPFAMGQIWLWFLNEVCVRAECVESEQLPCCARLVLLWTPSTLPSPAENSYWEMQQGQGLFQGLGGEEVTGINHQKESGIVLLPLSPVDATALVKYLKTAGPGLGLEEHHLWKINSGTWGN